MPFPPMPVFVRNDPFSPANHNNLLQRQDWLQDFLGVDHDRVTGEHNTPHVARSLGCVKWSGAAYSLEGFNADVSLEAGHNPAVGTVILTLAADRYNANDGVLELQTASENGNLKPSFATAKFTDATHVEVHLKQSETAVQQAFADTDMNFFIGIRSSRIPSTPDTAAGAARRVRGDGLAADESNWNPMIQRMGSTHVALLAGHTSTGLHDTREVAKAWGNVRYSTTVGYYIDGHQGLGAGVKQMGVGFVRVYLANCVPAVAAPVQAFARSVLGLPTPTTPEGLTVAVIPASSCGATSVDVYLYESYIDGTEYKWREIDRDFLIRVHGT